MQTPPDDPYKEPMPPKGERPAASDNRQPRVLTPVNGTDAAPAMAAQPSGYEPPYITADIAQGDTQEDEMAKDEIHSNWASCTKVISTYTENVLTEKPGPKYKVVKTLGKGGFGVVTLCERTSPDVRRGPHLHCSVMHEALREASCQQFVLRALGLARQGLR